MFTCGDVAKTADPHRRLPVDALRLQQVVDHAGEQRTVGVREACKRASDDSLPLREHTSGATVPCRREADAHAPAVAARAADGKSGRDQPIDKTHRG
jgi:hypothetical protein